jgi:hypothetical protein
LTQSLISTDYLMGHFSESNIESFIEKHSIGWHNHEFPVRLSWGGRRLLPVTVSALRMRDGLSEIGFNNQSFVKDGRPRFVRRNSPPLGIPLASIDEMQEEYSNHVREVVVNDLDHYVSIAYDGQRSSLPTHILKAVCLYYQMSVETKGVERKGVKKIGIGAVDEVSSPREFVIYLKSCVNVFLVPVAVSHNCRMRDTLDCMLCSG